MKPARRPSPARAPAARNTDELRARLAEMEDMVRAIRTGEVDALVVAGRKGPRVFTLEGAEHAYRVLIESMNEGALTLAADRTILYANQAFARLVKCPLEQVTGRTFRRFLSAADGAALQQLLGRARTLGSKIQVQLGAGDGSQLPVQLSIRRIRGNGADRATIGMVVTDLTEARRNEQLLRTLSHRLVQAHEAERGHVALELHDNITQLLCAILFRSQALAEKLPAHSGPAKRDAGRLCEMLSEAAAEVERIGRNLRPSILDHLGLVAVLRDASRAFARRTGAAVRMSFVELPARLPADAELALFRILQESLRNIESHARARHVKVCLRKQGAFVQLAIGDDGIGFDPARNPRRRDGRTGLGLIGMRERAAGVGGTLRVTSTRRAGTEIKANIPLGPPQRRRPAKAPHATVPQYRPSVSGRVRLSSQPLRMHKQAQGKRARPR